MKTASRIEECGYVRSLNFVHNGIGDRINLISLLSLKVKRKWHVNKGKMLTYFYKEK